MYWASLLPFLRLFYFHLRSCSSIRMWFQIVSFWNIVSSGRQHINRLIYNGFHLCSVYIRQCQIAWPAWMSQYVSDIELPELQSQCSTGRQISWLCWVIRLMLVLRCWYLLGIFSVSCVVYLWWIWVYHRSNHIGFEVTVLHARYMFKNMFTLTRFIFKNMFLACSPGNVLLVTFESIV